MKIVHRFPFKIQYFVFKCCILHIDNRTVLEYIAFDLVEKRMKNRKTKRKKKKKAAATTHETNKKNEEYFSASYNAHIEHFSNPFREFAKGEQIVSCRYFSEFFSYFFCAFFHLVVTCSLFKLFLFLCFLIPIDIFTSYNMQRIQHSICTYFFYIQLFFSVSFLLLYTVLFE